MIIVNKNDGKYIPYNLEGNNLSFDGVLTLALDKYEHDNTAHYDICIDKVGNLVLGVIPGVAELYAAQLDIPARQYTQEESGEVDDDNNPLLIPQAVAYTPDNTTLTLWGLEE